MHEKVDKAVEYVKESGLDVCLTTNGWLMTEETLERLLSVGVDHIVFSAQTPDKVSFELRGANVDFGKYQERIVSSIAKIIEHPGNTKATLSFLVTPFKKVLLPSRTMSIVDTKRELCRHFSSWLDKIFY